MSLLEIQYRCVTQILIFSQTLTGSRNILLPRRAPPPPLPPPWVLLIFSPLWLPYPQAFLSVVTSSPPHFSICFTPFLSFFFFYSASSLSPLIFSERLLDSVFSKFVPSLLLFLFLVITLLHSFERDVSLKSFITQFLLPCLPLPSFPCLLFSLPLCHSPGGFLLFVSLASLH